MIKILDTEIKPTIFPDKTSQVWKLSNELINKLIALGPYGNVEIEWEFENEAELIQVLQLKDLLSKYTKNVGLYIPYLPYARQDKAVTNESTFALHTFAHVINSFNFKYVGTLDIHNLYVTNELIRNLHNIEPKFPNLGPNTVFVFPDSGAYQRYYHLINLNQMATMKKNRDQMTGKITELKVDLNYQLMEQNFNDTRFLIVDDICDGGTTFIMAANELKKYNPKDINLYVTHGIFSKGIAPLKEAGINHIFTHKGLVNE